MEKWQWWINLYCINVDGIISKKIVIPETKFKEKCSVLRRNVDEKRASGLAVLEKNNSYRNQNPKHKQYQFLNNRNKIK